MTDYNDEEMMDDVGFVEYTDIDDVLEEKEPTTTVGKQRKNVTTGKDVVDYVDKESLSILCRDYNESQKPRDEQGLPRQPIPDSIGKIIMQMITGMGSRFNFRSYTYNDEMVGDAYIAAVRAVHKFEYYRLDKKGNRVNAYSFINWCAWQAMASRITDEKKQQKIKEDMMIDPSFEFFDQMEGDDNIQISRDGSLDIYWGGKLDDNSNY